MSERVGDDFSAAHRSRVLSVDDVRRSGLVLTASKAERAAVARLDPSARSRTFTLREAASLATATDVAAPIRGGDDVLASLATVLHARRGLMPPPRNAPTGVRRLFGRRAPTDPIDIADGHLLGDRQHRLALDDVVATVDRILSSLRAVAR